MAPTFGARTNTGLDPLCSPRPPLPPPRRWAVCGDPKRRYDYVLKARSRKHPGLAKRQNRFHTTKDRRERHEHLLRVSSDKRATRLRHKATYTYATVSPHLVLFPPLSHPHHRAATEGTPYNRPCAISATQKENPCIVSTPFSPTPQGGHCGSPIQSPSRHLRRAGNTRGRLGPAEPPRGV